MGDAEARARSRRAVRREAQYRDVVTGLPYRGAKEYGHI
jgi:hypothetical protein